jgi:hypothetical protein
MRNCKVKVVSDPSKRFIEDNRWPLAKQFLDRADLAANIVRGFLFSAATAGIGFIAYERHGTTLRSHLLPLILLGLSAAFVFVSWDIQKKKAINRFKALRDGKPHYDTKPSPWLLKNYILDRGAAVLIALGVILEIAIRLCAN